MATRTVIGTIRTPDGVGRPGATVRFQLIPGSFTATDQYPSSIVTTKTGVDGALSVTLWTNEEGDAASEYICTLPSALAPGGEQTAGETFHFTLPAGAADIELSVLRAAGSTPYDPQYDSLVTWMLDQWHDAWTATTYSKGDKVSRNGSSFIALTDALATDVPGVATAVWGVIAEGSVPSTHLVDYANPHAVTKAQVGLGLVENTALSTWAGTVNVTTVAASAVTAHQAALSLAWSQLTSGVPATFTPSAHAHPASEITAGTFPAGAFVFNGALSGITTLGLSGQLSSTLATGTAPFAVASTTAVANLNASLLLGATWAAPGSIGSGIPAAGAFTTLGATGPFSLLGTRGIEKVTNGNFTNNLDGWAGANWAWSAGSALHTAGAVTALSQAACAAVVGETYEVTFTILGTSMGSVQLYFGGVWGSLRSGAGTYTSYITATATDGLQLVPTTEFAGAIDGVTVRKITADTATLDHAVEFHRQITIHDRIVFADGRPISIGYAALPANTTGEYNVPSSNIAIGSHAGFTNTSGHVTAVGYYAGYRNTTGVLTAFGKWAGMNNTDGHATCIGNKAGGSNTTGEVTAVGDECLGASVIANSTAIGYYAANKATVNITAVGYLAAMNNAAGIGLTAVGHEALYNTTGSYCTAVGHQAGYTNTTGIVTAVGYRAAYAVTTGEVTAVGHQALTSMTTGKGIGIGYNAGQASTIGNPVFIGYEAGYANTTSSSVGVGYNAGYSNTTGTVTAIGSRAGTYNTTGTLIAIGSAAGYGTDTLNAPVTDTFGILIGQNANRSVASATVLTNYIGIGYGVLIDKSNQVKIGNTSIVETVLYGTVILPAATASLSPLRIPHGTAHAAPTDGDIWTTTAGLFVRVNGATKTVAFTA